MRLSLAKVPATRAASTALGLLMLLVAPVAAGAEIYRCTDALGTVIFADLPCAADAEIHRPGGTLSVIASADSLDLAARANREFIDQRRAELAAQRRAAANRERLELMAQQRAFAAAAIAAEQQRIRTRSLRDQHSPRVSRRTDQLEAERRRREQAAPKQEQRPVRGTLLSRSGGNRERILD